MEQSQNNTPKA
ncbi:hypothetical protein F66182_15547, partial [Fusarium sp. NRRL 66182]